MRPYPITKRDEVGAGLRQHRDFACLSGIADARHFDEIGPPFDPVFHRPPLRPVAAAIGLAEQHVIGARFAGQHGIMTAAQAAGAGDAVGFQAWQRRGERLDAAQMRAVGADPADDLDAAVEQKRNVAALHCGGNRLGAVDERALVGVGETEEHGGDVG